MAGHSGPLEGSSLGCLLLHVPGRSVDDIDDDDFIFLLLICWDPFSSHFKLEGRRAGPFRHAAQQSVTQAKGSGKDPNHYPEKRQTVSDTQSWCSVKKLGSSRGLSEL